MAKQVIAKIKLQAPGGAATPAPPVGPALGQHGVNIGQFVSQFNDRTKKMEGMTCPVEITVFKDKTFDFVVKSPPAAELVRKAAKPLDPSLALVEKGSGTPNTVKVGQIARGEIRKIAEVKKGDLNAFDIDGAMRTIEGTAHTMGIEVVD